MQFYQVITGVFYSNDIVTRQMSGNVSFWKN
jgi:hypothetical protein